MDNLQVVEGSMLIPMGEWEELPPKGRYLRFGLPGALITKSRNELEGKPCVVGKVGSHYEVHRIRRLRKGTRG